MAFILNNLLSYFIRASAVFNAIYIYIYTLIKLSKVDKSYIDETERVTS